MKRGTTPTLPVKVGIDPEMVAQITFLFKQQCSESATPLLEKTYPSEEVTFSDGAYWMAWTQEETRKFAEDQLFYMDTRIILKNGKIPETRIVTLKMNRTLFEED